MVAKHLRGDVDRRREAPAVEDRGVQLDEQSRIEAVIFPVS